MRVIVGVATFFDALDAVMIAYILPVVIPLWKIPLTDIGFLISSGYVGQLLGAIFFGWVAEKKGRIHALVWTVVVYAAASLACIVSWSYWSLLIFRFIQGIGLGGEVPTAAAYISELCKAKGRGRFVLLYEMIFAVGLVCAALLGYWVVPHLGWRPMFLIGALPALIVPILRRGLPESPRWLASKKRFDEAEKVVSEIERVVSEGGRRALPPVEPAKLAPVPIKATSWRELFRGIYLRRTLTVWVIWFCGYFCNYGLVAWLPTLYSRFYKLPLKQALLFSLITSCAGLVGTVLCAIFIDIMGRKTWFTGAFIGGCFFMVMLWLTGARNPLTVLLLSSSSYFFIGSISVALYLYSPEIYPTRMRALGSGVGTAWLRIASAIGPIAVGLVVVQYSTAGAFMLFGIVALFGAVITGLFAVETRGKVLEELSP
jgi:putative MFS transporter